MPTPQQMEDVVVATRFWATTEEDRRRLLEFLERARSYSQKIVVAINVDKDTQGTAELLQDNPVNTGVDVLEVSPWGGVTHALNLMLYHALKYHSSARYLLFQSVEAMASADDIASLAAVMKQHTGSALVAGHTLPGHPMHGCPGGAVLRALSADSTPWNTLAVWDVRMLGVIGFPSVADQVSPPGMEEVGAIAVQQKVFGTAKRQAILLCNQDVHWDTDFNGERQQKHERKMASKRERVECILGKFSNTHDDASALVCVYSGDTTIAMFEEQARSLVGMAKEDASRPIRIHEGSTLVHCKENATAKCNGMGGENSEPGGHEKRS